MGSAIDITGQSFHRLTAIKPTDMRKDKKIVWEFLCTCGETHYALAKSVKSGNTKSCGCLRSDLPASTSWLKGSRVEKSCFRCGGYFSVKKSHYERSRFCSLYCRYEDQKSSLTSDSNPNWKGGVSFCEDYKRERAKRWRDRNPEKISCYNRNRKMRRKKAPGKHTQKDIEKIYVMQRGKCAYCSKDISGGYHIDHVIPVSKGGSNDKENICISCPSCNIRKTDKDPIDWANERGFLL